MKMKGIGVIVSVLVVLGLLIGGFGCAPAAPSEVIKLKAQSWGGATYQARVMLEDVIDQLEATGRFEFDYFPGEPLMSAKEAFDGMREGVLDIAVSASGYHIDRMGVVGAIQWMPKNYDFEKFAANYRTSGFLDWAQPYYEKMGLRLLSDQKALPNILNSAEPIHTLEDMEGVLMRDAGTFGPWIELLGGTPVALPSAEFYEAAQRGVVESMIPSLSSYVSHKWYEVTPYVTLIEWFCGGMQLIMNNDVYNGLPADARTLLDDAVLEAEGRMWDFAREWWDKDIAAIEAEGVEIYTPPKEEMARWEAAIQPYYDSLEDEYGAEWTEFMKYRAMLK